MANPFISDLIRAEIDRLPIATVAEAEGLEVCDLEDAASAPAPAWGRARVRSGVELTEAERADIIAAHVAACEYKIRHGGVITSPMPADFRRRWKRPEELRASPAAEPMPDVDALREEITASFGAPAEEMETTEGEAVEIVPIVLEVA